MNQLPFPMLFRTKLFIYVFALFGHSSWEEYIIERRFDVVITGRRMIRFSISSTQEYNESVILLYYYANNRLDVTNTFLRNRFMSKKS